MPRSILDDIKQTRPFSSRGAELLIALLRTANVVHRQAEEVVAAEGLSLQQYNVLRILRGAKSPLPTMEIAERLVEQAPGITRLVNSLEQTGLLRREQWAGDRRCILCQITPAGLKLLEKLDDQVAAFDDAVVNGLSEEQVDTLLTSLAIIREKHQ
jgi:MarR family transcriptional regulator, organic hydroperoxide resistance regulator